MKTKDIRRAQPLVAWRALRQLIADPEDTPRVFEIIRALGGPSLVRGLRRFHRTAVGQRVLDERIDLLDSLRDRDALAALPAGSLGRAYHRFVYAESLTAEGLVDASDEGHGYDFEDPNLRRYAMRIRDQHDLWHTVTEYGRDPFGEACLLAFTYAQTRNRGVLLIALTAAWKISRHPDASGVFRAMWRAYRDGCHASWLPAQDWEALLPRPLTQVRRLLAVQAPEAYRSALAAMEAQPAG